MQLKDIRTIDIKGKSVVVREDLNVPMVDGLITDTTRIDAAMPTLQHLFSQGADLLLIAHLGRPEVNEFTPLTSLAPIASYISEKMDMPVKLVKELSDFKAKPGHIVMLENVRCYEGEMDDSIELGKTLASSADIYVFDAFACAHRAQASTHSAIQAAKIAAAGPLLIEEVSALEKAFKAPQRPMVSITGGAKVSSKVGMLKHLINISDSIIIGGGMANTFLAAKGIDTGQSLVEDKNIDQAKDILQLALEKGCNILLPEDVVIADSMIAQQCQIIAVNEIPSDQAIFDIGPITRECFVNEINKSKTVLWNGPLGVFEQPLFSEGTKIIGQTIANHSGFTIAGGGDTLAAINKFKLSGFDLTSTGGGAFLEWLEGKQLPAISALTIRD